MRISVLSFAAGAAIGYLLGAQAGRERYEQLVKAGQITAATARTAYSAAQTTAGAAQSAVERIRAARERAAERDRLDSEMDAALLTVEQQYNGHVRVN